MINLITAILVAVGGSVFLLVITIVGVAIWWRMRQDRLSLAMAQARLGEVLPIQKINDIRDSSQTQSGRAILGRLPYQGTHDWSVLGSEETFQVLNTRPNSTSAKKRKTRSLRSSTASGRLSKRRLQNIPPIIPLSSLDGANPTTENISPVSLPDSREKEPKSAIAGFSELPTENSPRNTPDVEGSAERQGVTLPSQPAPTIWPLLSHSGSVDPISGRSSYTESPVTRIRNGSVSTSTPSVAPNVPMPPPPVTYGRPVYQSNRDDSVMRLSSLSLETANSSILEDSMKAAPYGDGNPPSPSLPPCPTFSPFSPCDIKIGGSVRADKTSQRQSKSGRWSHSVTRAQSSPDGSPGLQSRCASPRRSQTTHESSHPGESITALPRRSGTVTTPSSKSERKSARERAKTLTYGCAQSHASGGVWNHHKPDEQLHEGVNNKRQRHSMYEPGPAKDSQSAMTKAETSVQTGQKQAKSPKTLVGKESPQKSKPTSAMKGGQGMRKGHRRQNCVRISIHPPTTFGGPSFPPTLEEPADSDVGEPHSSLLSTPQSKRHSAQSRASERSSPCSPAKHRSQPSPSQGLQDLDTSPMQKLNHRELEEFLKRRYSNHPWADDVFVDEGDDSTATIFSPTVLSDRHSLSKTPSPVKEQMSWPQTPKVSPMASSPRSFGECLTGSPRRSGVRGPRGQPVKSPRHSNRLSAQSSATGVAPPDTVHQKDSKDEAASSLTVPGSLDVRKSITLLRRMNSEAWDEESKHYMEIKEDTSDRNSSHRHSGLSSRRTSACPSTLGSVIIWEDNDDEDEAPSKRSRKSQTRSPRKSFASPQGNHEEPQTPTASTMIERQQSTESDSIDDTHKEARSPSRRKSKIIMTPTQNKMGLGIECTTPGSLYDVNGFLKE